MFFCCETEDKNDTTNSPTGYNCTTSGCLEDWTGSAQYATLDECVSVCPIDCSCGTIIDTTYYPENHGTLTPVVDSKGNLNLNVEGAYEEVTVYHVGNYCSGNIGTSCSGGEIGDEYCMNFQTNVFFDTVVWINGSAEHFDAICLSSGSFE